MSVSRRLKEILHAVWESPEFRRKRNGEEALSRCGYSVLYNPIKWVSECFPKGGTSQPVGVCCPHPDR